MPSLMSGTATAASTLVNSDPGPRMIWSAASSAAMASIGAFGSAGTRDTVRMWSVAITATWPSTWPASDSAFRTTGSVVAGSTRPWTPSSRHASSRAATGSDAPSMRPARIRLPSA